MQKWKIKPTKINENQNKNKQLQRIYFVHKLTI